MWLFKTKTEKQVGIKSLSRPEFRQLLKDLSTEPNICIRVASGNEAERGNFMYVNMVKDDTAFFYDDIKRKHLQLDIYGIEEFEISEDFKKYKSSLPYRIVPAEN